MRTLLKVLLFPITLLLNMVLAIAKFILVLGGSLLGILSFVFLLIGVGGMITGDYQTVGIPALIFGYLLSPLGLPLIAIWVIARIELFNDWLKSM